MKKRHILLLSSFVLVWAFGMSVYLLAERYVFVRAENERLTSEVGRLSDARVNEEVLGASEKCGTAAKYTDRNFPSLAFLYNSCDWKVAEVVAGLPADTIKRVIAVFNDRTVLHFDVVKPGAAAGTKCITGDYKQLAEVYYRFLQQANGGADKSVNTYRYVKKIDLRSSREFCYQDNSLLLDDIGGKAFVRITVQVENREDFQVNKADQIIETLGL